MIDGIIDNAKIKEYAGYLMPISDIAVLLNVDEIELKKKILAKNNPISHAYYEGKIEAKLEMHKQERELLSSGSPQALENLRSMLLDMEDEE